MSRLPFAALAPHIETRWRPRSKYVGHIGIVGKTAQVAGVSRDTSRRWLELGVPACKADRVATTIGMHPASIWPDWWDVT